MTRVANRFMDPRTGQVYEWPINHSDEEGIGRSRNFDLTAPTAHGTEPGVGLVRQQGNDDPLTLKLTGTILDPEQHRAFITFFEGTRTQSLYFRDFAGNEYEVLISSYVPKRERCARNPRTGGTHYWTYSMEMTVLWVRAGEWAGAFA